MQASTRQKLERIIALKRTIEEAEAELSTLLGEKMMAPRPTPKFVRPNGKKKRKTSDGTTPKRKRKEFKGQPCCGSKGSRHLADCPEKGKADKPTPKQKDRYQVVQRWRCTECDFVLASADKPEGCNACGGTTFVTVS